MEEEQRGKRSHRKEEMKEAAGEVGEHHIQHPDNQHWSPPGVCALPTALLPLHQRDCTSGDPDVKLLKFADDTTVIGLIRDSDESAYRREVEQLACGQNNLQLNTLKTVEMTVDFRRSPPTQLPLSIIIQLSLLVQHNETWLDPSIPDSAIVPEGLSIHRQDRTINSGKSKGGGVCFMVNNKWCSDVEIISSGCSPDLEHLMIRCRPYYLPREFTSVVMTAVYIPPHADNKEAMDELFGVIDRTEMSRPEASRVYHVAGDFNSANLRKVLPRYHQHISCPTRGENTLDHVYTPYARHKLKRDGPVTRTIQQWSDQSDSALRDCFSTTEWCVFKDTDINTYTDTVIGYIGKCIDDVVPRITVQTFPNQKPWVKKPFQKPCPDGQTPGRADGQHHILHPDSEHRRTPQGCVLSPLLYSLFTHDCVATHSSNTIVKFADDTTVIGLITGDDEAAYREVRGGGRERNTPPSPSTGLRWRESAASGSSGFTSVRTSPGTHHTDFITKSARQRLFFLRRLRRLNMDSRILCSFYSGSSNIDTIRKKAQQRMYFLRQLRKFNLPQELLIQFYATIIQSVLCTSITVWFGSATKQDRNRLQQTAEKIIGASLPSIQDLYVSRVRKRAEDLWKRVCGVRCTTSLETFPQTGPTGQLKTTITLHIAPPTRGTHVRLQFSFIEPPNLPPIRDLRLSSALCGWILNFLTDAAQGCALNHLLYSLFTLWPPTAPGTPSSDLLTTRPPSA
ncbi:hypothetical protein L3Q82_012829 [Scortum barcoo]|uniref:Uncharacterized protein n=1 Tax=Scortum barcoo TaxID=214431 RepID=A0ACB8W3Q5_9TELE|nr:hypothetical protein L3Q82_012829 [Scortum barcoo]